MQPRCPSIELPSLPVCASCDHHYNTATFPCREDFVDCGKLAVNNFLAELVFHFGESLLSTGIPRQHCRACAWIEDKKPQMIPLLLLSLQDYSFLTTSTIWITWLKKCTCTLQNTSSTTATASPSTAGIAATLFTAWFSRFHSHELWWHGESIHVINERTKEDS